MSDIMQIMLWPFIASLVLAGIHAYLGLHVVERGIIFVDLSLAQVAALGSAVALLVGYDLHGRAAYFFSLGFTLIGAALFAATRSRRSIIPQEAFIGIVYAVSAALAILIMDRLPEGAEHIKHILIGNLLAVSPWEVQKMALLYALIGALHWFWRKPFLTISTDPEEAIRKGYRVKLWDFLFYATFGFVVTCSVSMRGFTGLYLSHRPIGHGHAVCREGGNRTAYRLGDWSNGQPRRNVFLLLVRRAYRGDCHLRFRRLARHSCSLAQVHVRGDCRRIARPRCKTTLGSETTP